jgi:hypothetical protein
MTAMSAAERSKRSRAKKRQELIDQYAAHLEDGKNVCPECPDLPMWEKIWDDRVLEIYIAVGDGFKKATYNEGRAKLEDLLERDHARVLCSNCAAGHGIRIPSTCKAIEKSLWHQEYR